MSHEARIRESLRVKWAFNAPPMGKTRKDDADLFRADCYFEAITTKKRTSNKRFASKNLLNKGL